MINRNLIFNSSLIIKITIIFILKYNFAEIIQFNVAERAYIKSYIYNKEETDDFCYLLKEWKIAMCNAVMEDKNFLYNFRMYLNKVGISLNEHRHDCETHLISFETMKLLDNPQNMFPCYGRHDPVRTKWNIDDYYSVLFLSGGPEENSVFIYIRQLFPDYDKFIIYGYKTDMSIEALPAVSFEESELDAQMNSLKQWSFNDNVFEIETLYIRNVVKQKDKTIKNTICDLDWRKKMILCTAILSKNIYRNYYWDPNEAAFSTMSTECIPREITFVFAEKYNNKNIKQNMLACYAEYDLLTLQISAGFRDNSILVYLKYNENTYALKEFIENINFDDLFDRWITYFNDDGSPPWFDFKDTWRIIMKYDNSETNDSDYSYDAKHRNSINGIEFGFTSQESESMDKSGISDSVNRKRINDKDIFNLKTNVDKINIDYTDSGKNDDEDINENEKNK